MPGTGYEGAKTDGSAGKRGAGMRAMRRDVKRELRTVILGADGWA